MYTIRDEIAKRLKVYYRVYKDIPVSYNKNLGIGKLSKVMNKSFTGLSINDKRYINGILK